MNVITTILGSVLRVIIFTLFALAALVVSVIYLVMAVVRGIVRRTRRAGHRDRSSPPPPPGDGDTIVIRADGSHVR